MNRQWHVVFGTGALGLAVARAMVQRGARVRMVNRTGASLHAPNGVEMISADAYDSSQARAACEGAEVVYQCAAPAYAEWAERFPALQASIVGAASDVRARLVVGDNLYMYGDVDGPLVETLPHAATTKKGGVRARMAASLLKAHHERRVRVTIGRGSDFFGPAVAGSAVGERFFRAALAGRPVDVFGNADAPHSYTFVDDFGAALVELGERDEAFGRAWHVPSLPAISGRQFALAVITAAGTRSAIREVPRWIVRGLGLFAPPLREMVEMLYMFEKPFVVDDSAFTRAFATRATPLAAAVARTLRWYSAARESAS
jgi:nucleoside-diphosphate-sugar epimerase